MDAIIATIQMLIGFAISAVRTPPIFGITLIIVPIAAMTFPMMIKAGARTAVIAVIATITVFVLSSSEFKQVTTYWRYHVIVLSVGIIISLSDIANSWSWDFKIVIWPSRLFCIVAAIAAADPW